MSRSTELFQWTRRCDDSPEIVAMAVKVGKDEIARELATQGFVPVGEPEIEFEKHITDWSVTLWMRQKAKRAPIKALLMNGPADGKELMLEYGTRNVMVPHIGSPIEAGDPWSPCTIQTSEYRQAFTLPNGVVVYDCKR